MGNKKISELNLLTTPQLSTVIPVVEGGETQKLPVGTLLQSGLPIIASSIVASSLIVNGNINANQFLVTSTSISHYTASTKFGLDTDDTHEFTGSVFISGALYVVSTISASSYIGLPSGLVSASGVISSSTQITNLGYALTSSLANVTPFNSFTQSQNQLNATWATTGSNLFKGNQVISGSLFVSGTSEFGGNIVPLSPRGATLGTLERPFSEIFVSSGSINIASDIPGDPNTTLTNIGGNILVSAGGMRLVGGASFIAATGSFGYISGSMTQVGNYTQQGNYVMVGNKTISGSLIISGSGFINNRRILTDLDSGSFTTTSSLNSLTASFNSFSSSVNSTTSSLNLFTASINSISGTWATTSSNVFISGQTITGSVNVTGSVIITGSIIMDGTAQTYFSASVTNPSNYVIHQFLTNSYHGATYAFSVVENSTKKTTVFSNYIIAQGSGSINSNIGGDSKVESGAGAPNPSFTVGFSGSYAQFKVTDTGTFTYKGIVQLY
jgi:cytoskeletal protein CcmA (bactofilin family)